MLHCSIDASPHRCSAHLGYLCDLGKNRNEHLSVYFIESVIFTRRVSQLGLEQELQALQEFLVENPTAGRLDPGTGGLRKVWLPDSARNKGKRSGARAHYLFLSAHGIIYLLFVYGKNEQESLSPQQKKALAAMANKIKAEWST